MKLNLKFKFDFKKLFGKKSHSLDVGGPDSDWRKIFWVFSALTTIVIFSGLYIFFLVQSGTLFTVPSDPTVKSSRLNIDLLNKTVMYYQDRGSDFNNILNSKEVVKDPSRQL